jgi:hypothetical protein
LTDQAKNTPPAPPTAAELAKRKAEAEADKFTVYLARPQPKAWYADRDGRAGEAEGDEAEIRRARDRYVSASIARPFTNALI